MEVNFPENPPQPGLSKQHQQSKTAVTDFRKRSEILNFCLSNCTFHTVVKKPNTHLITTFQSTWTRAAASYWCEILLRRGT